MMSDADHPLPKPGGGFIAAAPRLLSAHPLEVSQASVDEAAGADMVSLLICVMCFHTSSPMLVGC